MELGPFGKTNRKSTCRKISLICMEAEGHCDVHERPLLFWILSQVKAVHSFPSRIFEISF